LTYEEFSLWRDNVIRLWKMLCTEFEGRYHIMEIITWLPTKKASQIIINIEQGYPLSKSMKTFFLDLGSTYDIIIHITYRHRNWISGNKFIDLIRGYINRIGIRCYTDFPTLTNTDPHGGFIRIREYKEINIYAAFWKHSDEGLYLELVCYDSDDTGNYPNYFFEWPLTIEEFDNVIYGCKEENLAKIFMDHIEYKKDYFKNKYKLR